MKLSLSSWSTLRLAGQQGSEGNLSLCFTQVRPHLQNCLRRRTWSCWDESKGGHTDALRAGAPPLWRQRERELGVFTWRRKGSRETLQPFPENKGAPRDQERDLEQGPM